MNPGIKLQIAACLGIGLLAAAPAGAQSFGSAKEKVTLVRKLPAIVQLKETTIGVRVSGSYNLSEFTRDFKAALAAELLKDDTRLKEDETNPSTEIICRITDYAHPPPTVTMRPTYLFGKNMPTEATYTRVTGTLRVSIEVRNASGQSLTSDNVVAKYDREFDSAGNLSSEGVKGTVTSAWRRLRGGPDSDELDGPTDAQMRALLMQDAVRKIAEHVVNTNESVDVFLARQRGPLEDGDKQAVAGLWEKALETFETAQPSPKPEDDAYRLYNIGVAYEALAYQAEDPKAAMKYLDEAAIDYGKAIDAKKGEHYFLEPQRRIEDAIAHYKQLADQKEQEAKAAEAPAAPAPAAAVAVDVKPGAPGAAAKPAAPKGLTNAQVIAMVKSGMDDDTVAQAIRTAKAVSFDLSAAGQQALTSNGVSSKVLATMKARSAPPSHPGTTHPTATHVAATHVVSK
jgi:tetratricopeptide (TPR) repeat protein